MNDADAIAKNFPKSSDESIKDYGLVLGSPEHFNLRRKRKINKIWDPKPQFMGFPVDHFSKDTRLSYDKCPSRKELEKKLQDSMRVSQELLGDPVIPVDSITMARYLEEKAERIKAAKPIDYPVYPSMEAVWPRDKL